MVSIQIYLNNIILFTNNSWFQWIWFNITETTNWLQKKK